MGKGAVSMRINRQERDAEHLFSHNAEVMMSADVTSILTLVFLDCVGINLLFP